MSSSKDQGQSPSLRSIHNILHQRILNSPTKPNNDLINAMMALQVASKNTYNENKTTRQALAETTLIERMPQALKGLHESITSAIEAYEEVDSVVASQLHVDGMQDLQPIWDDEMAGLILPYIHENLSSSAVNLFLRVGAVHKMLQKFEIIDKKKVYKDSKQRIDAIAAAATENMLAVLNPGIQNAAFDAIKYHTNLTDALAALSSTQVGSGSKGLARAQQKKKASKQ